MTTSLLQQANAIDCGSNMGSPGGYYELFSSKTMCAMVGRGEEDGEHVFDDLQNGKGNGNTVSTSSGGGTSNKYKSTTSPLLALYWEKNEGRFGFLKRNRKRNRLTRSPAEWRQALLRRERVQEGEGRDFNVEDGTGIESLLVLRNGYDEVPHAWVRRWWRALKRQAVVRLASCSNSDGAAAPTNLDVFPYPAPEIGAIDEAEMARIAPAESATEDGEEQQEEVNPGQKKQSGEADAVENGTSAESRSAAGESDKANAYPLRGGIVYDAACEVTGQSNAVRKQAGLALDRESEPNENVEDEGSMEMNEDGREVQSEGQLYVYDPVTEVSGPAEAVGQLGDVEGVGGRGGLRIVSKQRKFLSLLSPAQRERIREKNRPKSAAEVTAMLQISGTQSAVLVPHFDMTADFFRRFLGALSCGFFVCGGCGLALYEFKDLDCERTQHLGYPVFRTEEGGLYTENRWFHHVHVKPLDDGVAVGRSNDEKHAETKTRVMNAEGAVVSANTADVIRDVPSSLSHVALRAAVLRALGEGAGNANTKPPAKARTRLSAKQAACFDELCCRKCDSHLGWCRPNGKQHIVNSLALKLVAEGSQGEIPNVAGVRMEKRKFNRESR